MKKTSNFKKTIKNFLDYIGKYVPAIIVVLILSTIGTILQVLGPDKLKLMTDEIAKGLPALVEGVPVLNEIDLEAVSKIGMTLALFYGISTLINLVQGYVMATITQSISKKMRTDINNKINRLPMKYFDKVSYGDVLSRITNDVDTIGQALNQSITTLVTATTMFFGTLIMMFYNSWILALTAVFTTSFGFGIMFFIIGKSQRFFRLQQASLGKLNGHIEEIYSGHNIVKAYNAGEEAKEKFETINTELENSAWKSQFLSGLMMPLMQFIGNLGFVAVSVVGAALAMRGDISFGVIVAFMTYIRLFTQPLSQIAQAANRLQSAVAAGDRVFEFLDEPEERPDMMQDFVLQRVEGKVSFENVYFGYDSEKPVIKDFNYDVNPGEKVAIVGPTGAGKTTLVNLLMRFYDLDKGDILIDGISTQQILARKLESSLRWYFKILGSLRDQLKRILYLIKRIFQMRKLLKHVAQLG